MAVAVVVATGRGEVVHASLNVPETYVIARPQAAPALRKDLAAEVLESDGPPGDLRTIARLARTATEPLLLLPAGTVASGELLDRMTGPRQDLAAAVTGPLRGGGPPVRVGRDLVVSAGSGFHRVSEPNAGFAGVLRVAPARLRTLARVADRVAGLLETPGALPGVARSDDVETLGLLLVGLVREGVPVTAEGTPPLICRQVHTADEAVQAHAEVAALDEDRVRLDAAVKSNDGFFTTYAVSGYSRYLARWAARRGLTPNQVTSISMGIAVLAAVWFAAGTRTGMIVGAVLYYVAFVFDCVDGQLARYTRQFSLFGAWLDATFDRAKEYVVFAGLAVGSTVAAATSPVHGGDVWPLAVAALALQTCRHMIDFAYGTASQSRVVAAAPAVPLTVAEDGGPAGPPPLRRNAVHWAKKIIVLPIGERFALVSLTAALFNARVTFLALLVWGSVAASYTLAGRLLRSLHP